ncbi:hypothetical protein Esti_002984 [Eimeria stiedai]
MSFCAEGRDLVPAKTLLKGQPHFTLFPAVSSPAAYLHNKGEALELEARPHGGNAGVSLRLHERQALHGDCLLQSRRQPPLMECSGRGEGDFNHPLSPCCLLLLDAAAAWCCLVLLAAAWCCLVLLAAAWCSKNWAAALSSSPNGLHGAAAEAAAGVAATVAAAVAAAGAPVGISSLCCMQQQLDGGFKQQPPTGAAAPALPRDLRGRRRSPPSLVRDCWAPGCVFTFYLSRARQQLRVRGQRRGPQSAALLTAHQQQQQQLCVSCCSFLSLSVPCGAEDPEASHRPFPPCSPLYAGPRWCLLKACCCCAFLFPKASPGFKEAQVRASCAPGLCTTYAQQQQQQRQQQEGQQ